MKRRPAPEQPGLFDKPAGFFGESEKATKEGTLPEMGTAATPEEHVHNAVMHLAQTGEATVANVAARAGLSHIQAIGILSKLRQAGHLLRDGAQYRLGAPLPEGGLTAKPKASSKGTSSPARLLQPGEVEEAVRAAGFSHAGAAREALNHLQAHGRAGLIQRAKEARATMEQEFQRTGTHETPQGRAAAQEMERAGRALVAGKLDPQVQLAITGMEAGKR